MTNRRRYLSWWDLNRVREEFADLVINYYVSLSAVVIALFFTITITSEEIQDQTVSYFTMQPVSRLEIAIWKFLALLLVVNIFYLVPVSIFYWIKVVWDAGAPIDSELSLLFSAWVLLGMAALLYCSAFFLMSFIVPRPHLSCLSFGYADQFFLGTVFSPVLGAYSPAYHLRAIASREFVGIDFSAGLMPDFIAVMSVDDSYLVILLFFVVFISLAFYIFINKDLV
jgi:ABC-type transport system involved in multi-copper enzyme maturation permease subunit